MKQRYETLIAEYGMLVLVLYLGTFLVTLLGFAVAIRAGFNVEGVGAGVGTWAAAYVATKLTTPIRIGVTLVLTPIVARLLGKRKPEAAEVDPRATPGSGS